MCLRWIRTVCVGCRGTEYSRGAQEGSGAGREDGTRVCVPHDRSEDRGEWQQEQCDSERGGGGRQKSKGELSVTSSLRVCTTSLLVSDGKILVFIKTTCCKLCLSHKNLFWSLVVPSSLASCDIHQETGDINPTGIIYEEKTAPPPVSFYIIHMLCAQS